MHRSMRLLGGFCLATVLTACGGGNSGYIIPQETELKPWVEPSEDEVLESAGIASIDDAGDDEGDFVDYEDEEDGEAKEAAPQAAPAPASDATDKPAAKPAAKPVK